MKILTIFPLALVLFAVAVFIAPRPVHTGPGSWHYLGTDWSGPQERKVVAKTFVPAHFERCGVRTTNHGEGVGRCWIDEVSEVTLEGYGSVPVDITCFQQIQIGQVWDNKWKNSAFRGECK